MIRKDFTGLSDHFLTFNLDSIFNNFETDAWDLVLDLYRKKVEHSTCFICTELDAAIIVIIGITMYVSN